MRSPIRLFAAFPIVIFTLMVSCAPNTKIIGSWKSPELGTKTFKDIFILGLSDNFINRKTFEEDMAIILKEKGVKSTASVDAIGPGTAIQQKNAEHIEEIIKKGSSDAIMTMGLIDQTSETRYVQGSAYPMAGYGFRGYYGYYGGMAYTPGYYATDKSYFVEIKLFDLSTGTMVWSAQSETVNPSNLESAAMTFSRVVVDRMIKDGVIAGSK